MIWVDIAVDALNKQIPENILNRFQLIYIRNESKVFWWCSGECRIYHTMSMIDTFNIMNYTLEKKQAKFSY